MQNKAARKLFVCEFITGGGLNALPLPNSLASEGRLMRDALLRDLAELTEWQIITTHDVRVGAASPAIPSYEVTAHDDVWSIWQTCISEAEAVWLIAPETGGVLYRFTKMAQQLHKQVIGCGLAAIEITTSKYKTAQVLAQAQVSVIRSDSYADWFATSKDRHVAGQRWVVKPDDGAGCEETYVFDEASEVIDWFHAHPAQRMTHIIQPYVAGIAASICVLSYAGKVELLSCNYQYLVQHQHQLKYTGGLINGAHEFHQEWSILVEQIQQAIPALAGYYGVDVIIDANTGGNTDDCGRNQPTLNH